MLTASTADTSIHARRYPDEVKELAYQLWAFVYGRDCVKTQAALASGKHGDPCEVSYQAVAYWAREYGWAQRAADDVHKIAPDIRFQAFSELLFAGLDGAKYIRKVNAGQEEPNKYKIQAALAAVDRIGFSPVGSRNPTDGITAPATETPQLDFSTMTPEELREHEERIRKRVANSNTWVRVQR